MTRAQDQPVESLNLREDDGHTIVNLTLTDFGTEIGIGLGFASKRAEANYVDLVLNFTTDNMDGIRRLRDRLTDMLDAVSERYGSEFHAFYVGDELNRQTPGRNPVPDMDDKLVITSETEGSVGVTPSVPGRNEHEAILLLRKAGYRVMDVEIVNGETRFSLKRR